MSGKSAESDRPPKVNGRSKGNLKSAMIRSSPSNHSNPLPSGPSRIAGDRCENDESIWTLTTPDDRPGHFDLAINPDFESGEECGAAIAGPGLPRVSATRGSGGVAGVCGDWFVRSDSAGGEPAYTGNRVAYRAGSNARGHRWAGIPAGDAAACARIGDRVVAGVGSDAGVAVVVGGSVAQ